MNLFEEEYSGMISLYTRGLGMILNYEENWINVKEFSLAPEELLITLFVPDTTADITIAGETIHLGEYLRQREEADHMTSKLLTKWLTLYLNLLQKKTLQ